MLSVPHIVNFCQLEICLFPINLLRNRLDARSSQVLPQRRFPPKRFFFASFFFSKKKEGFFLVVPRILPLKAGCARILMAAVSERDNLSASHDEVDQESRQFIPADLHLVDFQPSTGGKDPPHLNGQ